MSMLLEPPADAQSPLFVAEAAWPVLLSVPLVLFAVYAAGRRASRARDGWSPEFLERVPGAVARSVRLALCTALLSLAWMDPRVGTEEIQVSRLGADIVLCVDVSRSMLAEDLSPNRLARAKRDIESLLGTLGGGDRVALVAFAGEADLLVPLTHDVATVRSALEPLDWDSVFIGGSDLAKAIRKGLEAAEDSSAKLASASIVLLTDGEDHERKARDAARAAASEGVSVHAIGYGSPRGAKITAPGDDDQGERFQTDDDGQEIVTALAVDDLRAVVEQSAGGAFLRADAAALPLLELKSKRIDPAAARVYDEGSRDRRKPQFQWLLIPALLILLYEVLTAGGRR